MVTVRSLLGLGPVGAANITAGVTVFNPPYRGFIANDTGTVVLTAIDGTSVTVAVNSGSEYSFPFKAYTSGTITLVALK